MTSARSIDLFPFASPAATERFGLALKPSVILIRWPVVIICTYLLLYPSVDLVAAWFSYSAVFVYIASNVALYFFPEERFASWSFYYPLVIADTIILTLSLVVNGYSQMDFYLCFFVVILGSCIIENAKLRAVVSVAAPFFYSVSLFSSLDNFQPNVFLRLPFLFVVSLFYGYFTQFIRREKTLRQEEELRDRGRKEVLNIVSHEFRTPLNVISGYAQAIQEKTWGDVTPGQDEALGKILRQSDNLMDIVNAVLDITRIETGELALEREELPLSDYLSEVSQKYVPLQKSVALQWEIPNSLPKVNADKLKLTIILQNLINNALKFTEKGNVSVTARVSRSKHFVEIEVKDTGMGIPKEAHALIFEKFQQADPSSTRIYGGIGLGLYIVKVFTDLLGGTISLESEPEKGSTFTLSLPAVSARVA
jgi:signal transduction histidine kinase